MFGLFRGLTTLGILLTGNAKNTFLDNLERAARGKGSPYFWYDWLGRTHWSTDDRLCYVDTFNKEIYDAKTGEFLEKIETLSEKEERLKKEKYEEERQKEADCLRKYAKEHNIKYYLSGELFREKQIYRRTSDNVKFLHCLKMGELSFWGDLTGKFVEPSTCYINKYNGYYNEEEEKKKLYEEYCFTATIHDADEIMSYSDFINNYVFRDDVDKNIVPCRNINYLPYKEEDMQKSIALGKSVCLSVSGNDIEGYDFVDVITKNVLKIVEVNNCAFYADTNTGKIVRPTDYQIYKSKKNNEHIVITSEQLNELYFDEFDQLRTLTLRHFEEYELWFLKKEIV